VFVVVVCVCVFVEIVKGFVVDECIIIFFGDLCLLFEIDSRMLGCIELVLIVCVFNVLFDCVMG